MPVQCYGVWPVSVLHSFVLSLKFVRWENVVAFFSTSSYIGAIASKKKNVPHLRLYLYKYMNITFNGLVLWTFSLLFSVLFLQRKIKKTFPFSFFVTLSAPLAKFSIVPSFLFLSLSLSSAALAFSFRIILFSYLLHTFHSPTFFWLVYFFGFCVDSMFFVRVVINIGPALFLSLFVTVREKKKRPKKRRQQSSEPGKMKQVFRIHRTNNNWGHLLCASLFVVRLHCFTLLYLTE